MFNVENSLHVIILRIHNNTPMFKFKNYVFLYPSIVCLDYFDSYGCSSHHVL